MVVFLYVILLVFLASVYAMSCICQLSNKEYMMMVMTRSVMDTVHQFVMSFHWH